MAQITLLTNKSVIRNAAENSKITFTMCTKQKYVLYVLINILKETFKHNTHTCTCKQRPTIQGSEVLLFCVLLY